MNAQPIRDIEALYAGQAQLLTISPADARAMRNEAWLRYVNYPHVDIDVGWKRYLAEIAAIDALAERLVA